MNPTDNSTVRVNLQEVDDSGPVQRVRASGRHGEMVGGAQYKQPRPQSYPMSAVPPKGALGAYSALGGRRDQAMVGHLEHPLLRPRNQQEKEWKLYDAFGVAIGGSADGSGQGGTAQEPVNFLHATADGWVLSNEVKLTLQVGTSSIVIEPDKITISADQIISTVPPVTGKIIGVGKQWTGLDDVSEADDLKPNVAIDGGLAKQTRSKPP